jgi:hypothetical protein
MNPPVIFLIGPVGHGKTTAREIIARLTYLKGGSCSDVIYAFLSYRKNVSQESLRRLPKEFFRPQLIEAGDFLVGQIDKIAEQTETSFVTDNSMYRRPSALIRTLYHSGYHIIDGVRRRAELVEAADHLEWNGVRHLTIHVSVPGKATVEDNSEDLRDMAHVLVENSGTVEDLEAILKREMEKAFGPFEATTPIPVVDLKTGQLEALGAEEKK